MTNIEDDLEVISRVLAHKPYSRAIIMRGENAIITGLTEHNKEVQP